MKKFYNDYGGTLPYPVGNDMLRMKGYVQGALKAFEKLNPELRFQSERNINLFCRGSSGAICAALFVAYAPWHCKIIHIKKPGESAHCDALEFNPDNINVIIDDFMSSGDTVAEIYHNANSNQYKSKKLIIDVLIVQRGWHANSHLKVGFIPKFLISNC
jgi:hypothetical protein